VYYAIQNQPVVQVQIAEKFAVVATKTVPVGVMLTADMVRIAAWPASAPVAGGFEKTEDVVGRGVTVAMVANEPVIESKLAPREAGAGLPPTIPPGMRAMAIRVNDVSGVAGFTAPGTKVDVIVTVRTGQDTISRMVISNVQVLTAGTNMDVEKARSGEATPAPVVTLLVTPENAERLALAANQGQLMLALRNPLDTLPTETTGARVATLFGALVPPPPAARSSGSRPAPRATPPPPTPPYTVNEIRGSNTSQRTVKRCPPECQ
jgi:pilus assembly protein CpaB